TTSSSSSSRSPAIGCSALPVDSLLRSRPVRPNGRVPDSGPSKAMTQQQSPGAGAPSRLLPLLPLLAAIVFIAAFVLLQVKRLPFDAPLTYDEGTHLSEGVEVGDALAARDWPRVARYFLEQRVMKGIIYRLWYGVTFLVLPPG